MPPRTGPRKGREDRGAAGDARPGTRPSSAILDAAFHRAFKAVPHGTGTLDRSRRRALLKIVRSSAVVVRHLRSADARFAKPGLSAFEEALVDQKFGSGALARSRRRVQRAVERVRGLAADEQRKLRRASSSDGFALVVTETYGRLASFVREVDPDLVRLREVVHFLKLRPTLDPLSPTVVIAGFPNVGKSSLVARLSTARPKVAEYPFTTLALEVGHADVGFDRLQVLDTPGVLNRSARRTDSEQEAEAAVERAATLVVFLLDPSESCGYPMADQERLLDRWRAELPDTPILVVATKADLAGGVGPWLRISAKTGEGVDALRQEIVSLLAARRAHSAPGAPMPGVRDI